MCPLRADQEDLMLYLLRNNKDNRQLGIAITHAGLKIAEQITAPVSECYTNDSQLRKLVRQRMFFLIFFDKTYLSMWTGHVGLMCWPQMAP